MLDGSLRCVQRFLLPQSRFHPPSLFAGDKDHPRSVRNGPLRREGAARTAIRVPGPAKRVFSKAMHLRQTSRRRPTGANLQGQSSFTLRGSTFFIGSGKRVFAKSAHLRRTSPSVQGDDHWTSQRGGSALLCKRHLRGQSETAMTPATPSDALRRAATDPGRAAGGAGLPRCRSQADSAGR